MPDNPASEPPITEYTLSLRDASIELCMPQDVVLKCIRRVARPNGGIKLDYRNIKGKPFFRKAGIDEYVADLYKPWVAKDTDPRPDIPDYFENSLKLETSLLCGVCGSPYAKDFAHVIPWSECLNNHPWNILYTCTQCHRGGDTEKRISREEMKHAKDFAQASFRNQLKYGVGESQLLSYLSSFGFPINGTTATGIDFLLSAIVPGEHYLHVTKIRGVELFSMLGDGANNAAEIGSLIRLTELSLIQVENSRLFEPFWHEATKQIYEDRFYPWLRIQFGTGGDRLLEQLLTDAGKYIDPSKYRGLESLSPMELIDMVTRKVEAEQERRDNKFGRLDEEGLDDFRT